MILVLDWTYHAHQFIFCFFLHFLFIACGRLSSLSVSFLLHVKYTVSCMQYKGACVVLQAVQTS